MARRPLIDRLPDAVLTELHERLLGSNFADYDSHSQWLSQRGFVVSKSAIHRYAHRHKDNVKMQAIGVQASTELKLRCLEIAVRLPKSDRASSATTAADELLRWLLA